MTEQQKERLDKQKRLIDAEALLKWCHDTKVWGNWDDLIDLRNSIYTGRFDANDSEAIKSWGECEAQNQQLREELERVKIEREGVMNYLSNTHMTANGEPAMIFMEMLVGLFEQNGGKNFLTMTVERKDKSARYSITIENLNGQLSAAEKMQNLQDEIDAMRKQAEAALNGSLEQADEALRNIAWAVSHET